MKRKNSKKKLMLQMDAHLNQGYQLLPVDAKLNEIKVQMIKRDSSLLHVLSLKEIKNGNRKQIKVRYFISYYSQFNIRGIIVEKRIKEE